LKIQSATPGAAAVEFETERVLAGEEHFVQALSLERKRAERSGQHFLLMLLKGAEALGGLKFGPSVVSRVTVALGSVIRDTDLLGWYRQGRSLGVIFTEVNQAELTSTVKTLNAKVEAALRGRLERRDVERIEISFHLFPEASEGDGWQASEDSALYPDMRKRRGAQASRVDQAAGS